VSQKYQQTLIDAVAKLSLQPGDILIVHSPEAMSTFLEMTQQGVGFTPYANPVLLCPGGVEKATRQELLEALLVIDQSAAEQLKETETVSRIITDLNMPALKRVQ
jgi:hypothetical protein